MIVEQHDSDGNVEGVSFFCPGCQEAHCVPLDKWKWNGERIQATIQPALIVRPWSERCHVAVQKGVLRFRKDCHHRLAGQAVKGQPFPD